MKKLLILGILCLTAALVLPAFASQPEAPADGIKMTKSGKKEVVFNHSTHKAESCATCHHPVDGKEDYRPCGTEGCHDITGTADKSQRSYNQAMHKKKDNKHQSCVSCHEKAAGDDKAKKKELAGCAKSKCHP
ncbi:cytochrome c3 family protein [Desulfovibrio sp. OttesenSCG-928-A18]|nr:cytochrome c3 family protein [Desulfovibrio sp. OttesenSCG-928-A18]